MKVANSLRTRMAKPTENKMALLEYNKPLKSSPLSRQIKIQIKHSAKYILEIIQNLKYLYNVINVWIYYTIVCFLKKDNGLEKLKI